LDKTTDAIRITIHSVNAEPSMASALNAALELAWSFWRYNFGDLAKIEHYVEP